MKPLNFLIISISLGFFVLNFLSLYELSPMNSRVLKWLGTMTFFAIALKNKTSRKGVHLLIFALLCLSDFSLIFYENVYFKTLQFILRGCAYFLIGVCVLKYLKNYSLSVFQKLFILLISSINLFLLYSIADTFHAELGNSFTTILFYFQGIMGIFLLALGAIFISEIINAVEITFFLCAIGFVMTDLASFAAYHLEYEDFFILARGFYIVAVACLLKYITYADEAKYLKSSYKD